MIEVEGVVTQDSPPCLEGVRKMLDSLLTGQQVIEIGCETLLKKGSFVFCCACRNP